MGMARKGLFLVFVPPFSVSFSKVVLLILILVSVVVPPRVVLGDGGEDNWCYDAVSCGPSTWGGKCSSGIKQSPINIVPSRARIRLQSSRLVLNTNYAVPKNFMLKNTDNTVKLYVRQDGTSKCLMVGDGLGQTPYYFSQLHFHWGPNNFIGSEHRIAGRSFPLEMHMVHVQQNDSTKLAVLSILFRLSSIDNPTLQPIINNLNKVPLPSDSGVIMPQNVRITLASLLPKRMRMFRYIGSLTTPPCTENVIWTVFQDPVPVSRKQLAAFRGLTGPFNRKLRKNFRPLQQAFTTARRNIYFLRILASRGRTQAAKSIRG